MADREKVIERLKRVSYYFKSLLAVGWQGDVDIYREHMESVNMALTLLKEQEAKPGKWERQYSRPGVFANLFWWCSVCGQPTRYNDAGIFYQYCPCCGAKLEPCKET